MVTAHAPETDTRHATAIKTQTMTNLIFIGFAFKLSLGFIQSDAARFKKLQNHFNRRHGDEK
jgi:hypothetical protein